MVRTIDADARRALLAESVWRLIRRDGLRAASVRGVAAEAGLATGSVRHFFPTQTELHVFAMESLAERIARRVGAHQAIDDLPERALAMVCELLPLTDETEAELRAWLEFVAASASDPALAAVARATFAATRDFLATVVRGQVELGLVPPTTDVDAAVVELNALVDGLTLQLVLHPGAVDRAQARDAVAHRLALPRTGGDTR